MKSRSLNGNEIQWRLMDFFRIKPKVWNFTKKMYINFSVMATEMKIQVCEV
jgi:hypothetical protein